LIIYGAIFPLLAFVLGLALALFTYYVQIELGRYVHEGDKTKFKIIDNDCMGAARNFKYSLLIAMTVAPIFYSIFLFDTLGDVVGFGLALWLFFVMLFVPGAAYACYWTWKYLQRRVIRLNSFDESSAQQKIRSVSTDMLIDNERDKRTRDIEFVVQNPIL
jgi:hypothetical protein